MKVAVTVGLLVVAMIAGVLVFPLVEEATKNLPEDPPEALVALLEVLPIVFIAVMLLGAVGWITYTMGWGREREYKPVEEFTKEEVYGFKPPKSLKERIRMEEQRERR